ncbi:MAG: glycosyltransferase family 2 protein [Gammaproteobacteria bacterium]
MITLNEAHHLAGALQSLKGFAHEIFVVDSYSTDQTVDLCLRQGVQIVQRKFRGFGDQWNFALREMPITAPWTLKLDPDERLSDNLKESIRVQIMEDSADGLMVSLRLWFMGKPLPVERSLLRVWKTGRCRFTDVTVNEYPIVKGRLVSVAGELEHHDSPDLEHWLTKQNRYTSALAAADFMRSTPAVPPRLFGGSLERRMWFRRHFWKLPGRYLWLFLYHWGILGAWRAGRVGWIWAHLRTEVYRLWEYKRFEMERLGHVPAEIPSHPGAPDPRVRQYD